MVEDIVPTRNAIWFARLTAVLQTLIIGPLSLASTIVSLFSCCLCIPCIVNTQSDFSFAQFFQNCIVGWGFFWLFLLFFFPLAVIGGIIFLLFLLIISPCYIYQK
jgi:hypothetical protein